MSALTMGLRQHALLSIYLLCAGCDVDIAGPTGGSLLGGTPGGGGGGGWTPPAPALEPILVAPHLKFSNISAGMAHTCAVTTEGVAYCWGSGGSGETGHAGNGILPADTARRYVSIQAASGYSCGLSVNATLHCWGLNYAGQLGVAGEQRSPPSPVDLTPIRAASAGSSHVCGLSGDELYCWGSNNAGELGLGRPDATPHPVPERVEGVKSPKAVSAGWNSTCAVSAEGEAFCWGLDWVDQFQGTTSRCDVPGTNFTACQLTPRRVETDVRFATIGNSGQYVCGLSEAGEAFCWGGTFSRNRTLPERVGPDLKFTTLSVGRSHACGVSSEGVGYCWGNNTAGKLGDGSVIDNAAPTPVAGGHPFREISAGYSHTCGVTTAGSVYCWGDPGFGNAIGRSETGG